MSDAPAGDASMPVVPLRHTVAALLAPGKGILAADESVATIGKRFAALGIPSTGDTRLAYREMLCTTPGLGEFISGVILFDETIRQKMDAVSTADVLISRGIIPGIKVDLGTVAIVGFHDEKITEGLDGLTERLAGYRQLGARFTKWRAVIALGDRRPTRTCLEANAEALARFAAASQEAGLVPIVEPEVLMDGNHPLAQCEDAMHATLHAVFNALDAHRVLLEGMLLKTGMVLPGKDCPEQVDVNVVAAATLRSLRRTVPAAVPGIVFLSGGQQGLAATERLNAICRSGDHPWKLSFSYGRALQDEALQQWNGSPTKRLAAQAALRHRARCNGLAVLGRYSAESEIVVAPGQT